MNVGADGHCIVFVKEYIFVDDNEAGGGAASRDGAWN